MQRLLVKVKDKYINLVSNLKNQICTIESNLNICLK